MFTLIDILNQNRIIPVIVMDNIEHAIPLAETLLESGFNVLEITLRTACALAAIEKINTQFPEAIVGAGTIIETKQFSQIKSVGAKFAVSPGLSKPLVLEAEKQNIPYMPGIVTLSEAMLAYQLKLNYLKFYPAESMGGIKTLRAITEILPLHFCPTGGLNANNFIHYLTLPAVRCVAGTWIAPRKLIAKSLFDEIAINAHQTQKILRKLVFNP
ncbi:bifunctional 4-hydroxy-2-oxoglutarate aldolase/2-dehydro-3-deoxy-phosphogluconate aldolase [Rickettsiella grylli]|uniref:Khg/kdpg aldolase n=1 Tax=Rickettsiella grylli TaxID=59196 RepID=A8PK32_9COXI|nr:bifunctional 4-hydroxy-2-oxoglutarate aldolase/2-dehydro-3-deoxy-phosphogluconate aldolase [Rickettsiella grylli]EDP46758.1 khg/kdpg aldolase [Rickettsiella grylli]